MAKIRIYKVAEQLGMPTHEVMDILKSLGSDVKNHMSSIDEEYIELLQEEREYQKKEEEKKRKRKERTIQVKKPPYLKDIARLLDMNWEDIVIKLADWNVIFDSKKPLPPLVVERLAREKNWEITWEDDLREKTIEALQGDLQIRPPIVTVLGHVDHGKTTLLDAIRHSKVAESEYGGITQKIGAYQIEINNKKITFVDTPGHEAFTAMRARGAQVTDIAILVVAADDGVMPQTIEALQHAKAADVSIIVAINKIDKSGANPDRIKQQLSEHGLVPEEWGGDTIFMNISALQKKGINDLLEMILLQAEILELKARYQGFATGTIMESRLDRGKGPVATVIVKEGTLKIGDFFVAGATWGKVRSLFSVNGKAIKEALPSMPVEIVGFSELPPAGTQFMVLEDEKIARLIANQKQQKEREKTLKGSSAQITSLEELLFPEEGKKRELNIILKADFQGSLDAIEKVLSQIGSEEIQIQVLSKGVGNINEADVVLAAASKGIVIGFDVKLPSEVSKAAKREGVDVRLYRVIYDVIEDLQNAIKGMITPKKYLENIGKAEVRAVFKIPKTGVISGSYVTSGKIERNAFVRVIRKGEVLEESAKIVSLKRFKEDVKEVTMGYECGIGLDRFENFEEGDILEAYIIREEI
ncbi:MAG: translation initiation factor IF-2 [Candidatus Atribacteria bacterium]|nr:translation initiation factor IF-2 [Candidatus Atribacteria bacterium]